MTMKKYLFLFAVCVSLALSSGQAYAQRYLPGMKGVELRGGFAGNLKSPVDWYTGFAVSGYTKRANHWVAGVEYLLKNYGYRGTFVPRAQFTAEGGYYLKFLSDPAKIFFLSVGGSALVGYETLNWGEKVLYDGSMLAYRDAFVYGGALTLELESYVTAVSCCLPMCANVCFGAVLWESSRHSSGLESVSSSIRRLWI